MPATLRPGFSRTWGVSIVTDMYAEEQPDKLEATLRCVAARANDAYTLSLLQGAVSVEIVDSRLRISVHQHVLARSLPFEVELTASVRSGRLCLPLTIGPLEVAQSLPRPLPMAAWSREIPLTLAGDREAYSTHLRIFEAQAGAAIIAQATWDPGVLLAAYVAHAWRSGMFLGAEVGSSHVAPSVGTKDAQPVRVVEVGCGVGIAGLALAAVANGQVRLALTDGDSRACELAKRNAAANALESVCVTTELKWGARVGGVLQALGGAPHVILAADVIYRTETFAPLVATLTALCDASQRENRPVEPAGESNVEADNGAEATCAAHVLLAYRPRVDDSHFWHLLAEEFCIESVGAPPSALLPDGTHEQTASNTDNRSARRPACAADLDGPDGASQPSTRIFRLRRRPVRVPTTCRHCALMHTAKTAAKAAIAMKAFSRQGLLGGHADVREQSMAHSAQMVGSV